MANGTHRYGKINSVNAAIAILLAAFLLGGCASDRTAAPAPADLIQGILECTPRIESTSSTNPVLVRAYGRTWSVYLTDIDGPKLRYPQLRCARIISKESRSEKILNFPMCFLDGHWRVFGSGYGPVTWANSLKPLTCTAKIEG